MAWRPRFTPANAEFSSDSLSGEVLALALHLGVFGAGLHPDGAGCLKHLKVPIIIILNNPE